MSTNNRPSDKLLNKFDNYINPGETPPEWTIARAIYEVGYAICKNLEDFVDEARKANGSEPTIHQPGDP